MMRKLLNYAVPAWVKVAAIALAIAGALGGAYAIYHAYNNVLQTQFNAGLKAGKAACETAHQQAISQARADAITQAQDRLTQQQQHGERAEQRRSRIHNHFDQLGAQLAAAHQQTGDPYASAIDGGTCVLPAERLRIWQAANRGHASGAAADHGATAIQPAGSAPTPAATDQRANAHAGAQPSGDGAHVSPTGGATLRPAAMAASRAGGVQPVADADIFGGH